MNTTGENIVGYLCKTSLHQNRNEDLSLETEDSLRETNYSSEITKAEGY